MQTTCAVLQVQSLHQPGWRHGRLWSDDTERIVNAIKHVTGGAFGALLTPIGAAASAGGPGSVIAGALRQCTAMVASQSESSRAAHTFGSAVRWARDTRGIRSVEASALVQRTPTARHRPPRSTELRSQERCWQAGMLRALAARPTAAASRGQGWVTETT